MDYFWWINDEAHRILGQIAEIATGIKSPGLPELEEALNINSDSLPSNQIHGNGFHGWYGGTNKKYCCFNT